MSLYLLDYFLQNVFCPFTNLTFFHVYFASPPLVSKYSLWLGSHLFFIPELVDLLHPPPIIAQYFTIIQYFDGATSFVCVSDWQVQVQLVACVNVCDRIFTI